MIHYRSEEEIGLLKQSSLLVGKTLAEIAVRLKPGVKTSELDRMAEEFIRSHGATPGFKNYKGYPATLCISVNDQVVHGIPGERIIREGDIVSVDCGTILRGYYGDSAYTFAVGDPGTDVMKLLRTTRASLMAGIAAAKAGNRIGDIGFAIQSLVEAQGFSVVRDLVGHGLGTSLHEEPQVPNFGKRGSGIKLQPGMVFCIEPMINLGKRQVVQEADGWTIRTMDGKPSAHYEHTVAVLRDRTEVLSTFEYIENVKNEHLKTLI